MERMSNTPAQPAVIRDHRRQWRDCLYVYPVISRRSKGVSIGVNLNPRRECTFSCAYCQIDRSVPRGLHEVTLPVLRDELVLALRSAVNGQLWHEDRFRQTPEELRRVNDIAFSGDGEPTCLTNFDQAVQVAADVKSKLGLGGVKLVVITNSTQLDSPQVARSLPILDDHNGEIWAKLDAGSEKYFQHVNRPSGGITLDRIVQNIIAVATGRPVVIQSLFMKLEGKPPSQAEIKAYCSRLKEIMAAGGRIKLVQVHTVARTPAETTVSALEDKAVDKIAAAVEKALGDVPVEAFYGG